MLIVKMQTVPKVEVNTVGEANFTHFRFSAGAPHGKGGLRREKQFINACSTQHVGETSMKSNSKQQLELWLV